MDSVTLAPMPADEQQASFIGGSNLAVFESSENRDAAWKFVQWLSEPEVAGRSGTRRPATCPRVEAAWDDRRPGRRPRARRVR